jgi:hypothetical protein
VKVIACIPVLAAGVVVKSVVKETVVMVVKGANGVLAFVLRNARNAARNAKQGNAVMVAEVAPSANAAKDVKDVRDVVVEADGR